jgi:transcriptional regulator with XRE-family HTH domain
MAGTSGSDRALRMPVARRRFRRQPAGLAAPSSRVAATARGPRQRSTCGVTARPAHASGGTLVVTQAPNTSLGTFLRSRRARVAPYEAGLLKGPAGLPGRPGPERRRVPGLRREELARLAGVSVDYYARLEQGRQATASPAVLDSMARALRLTTEERTHLYDLAGVSDGSADTEAARGASRRAQRLIHMLGPTPVILRGQFMEVFAVNPAAAFLFADFNTMPARERNGLRWMLLDPAARELYGRGWEEAAREMIGRLRLDAGRAPGHPRLAELVAELGRESPLFRRVWAEQHVSAWLHDRKTLYHPSFGSMDFSTDFVTMHAAPGQTLVVLVPADKAAFEAALDGG